MQKNIEMTLEEVNNKKIVEIENKIKAYTNLLELYKLVPANEIEEVFLLYIKFKKVSDIARVKNNRGDRTTGTLKEKRKFTSYDITSILEDLNSKQYVNNKLYKIVMQMKKTRKLSEKMLIEIFDF